MASWRDKAEPVQQATPAWRTKAEPVQATGQLPPDTVRDGTPVQPSVPPAAAVPDWNPARNMGARGADLLGNLFSGVGTFMERGEEYLTDRTGINPGAAFGSVEEMRAGGYEPDLSLGGYGVDFRSRMDPAATNAGEQMREIGSGIANQDFGYQPNYTIDRALDDPSLRTIAGAVGEQGPAALADLAALFVNTPAYLASRTEEIGQERAKNDGREGTMPTGEDLSYAAPGAAASVALDKLALGRLLPGATPRVSSMRQVPGAVLRGGATEAGTEAVQEGLIEYGAESANTEAGWDPTTALRRGAGGALIGGPIGGGVRGLTSVAEARAAVRADAEANGVDPASVTDEQADLAIQRALEVSEEQRLTPEELDAVIRERTGQDAAPPMDRSTPEGRQRARQTENELGDLFRTATDINRRGDVEITEDGATLRDGARPAQDPTGEQANPETFAVRQRAVRALEDAGLEVTPESIRRITPYIAQDTDVSRVVNAFGRARRSEDMRDVPDMREELGRERTKQYAEPAFRVADARRQRMDGDVDAGGPQGFASDYRAAAIPEERQSQREVTLLDAQTDRQGRLTGGEAVEVIAEGKARNERGQVVDAMRIRVGDNDPEWVEAGRISTVQTPENPRLAQQARAETRTPPAGVGTVEGDAPAGYEGVSQTPQPRRATDRIADPDGLRRGEFIPGERGDAGPQGGPRQGDTYESGAQAPQVVGPRTGPQNPDQLPQLGPDPEPTAQQAGAVELGGPADRWYPEESADRIQKAREYAAQRERRAAAETLEGTYLADHVTPDQRRARAAELTREAEAIEAGAMDSNLTVAQRMRSYLFGEDEPLLPGGAEPEVTEADMNPTPQEVGGVDPVQERGGRTRRTDRSPAAEGGLVRSDDEIDALSARHAALDAQVDGMSDEQLDAAADTMGYRGSQRRDAQAVRDRLKKEHPDDIERVLVDTGATPQRDASEGQGGGTLYSGIPLDKITEAIRKVFGGEREAAKFQAEKIGRLLEDAREVTGGTTGKGRTTKRSILTDAWRTVFATTDGNMRALVKNFDSPTLKSIPDMFHAVSGRSDGVEQTYDESIQARNKRFQEIDEITSFMRDNGLTNRERQRQLIRLVENPRAPRRGKIGEAAKRIDQFFKEELAYLRDAGVEVGDVSDGYVPRVMDSGKAYTNRDEFITQAIKAYQTMGQDRETAAASAEAYWDTVVYGVSGKPGWTPRGGQTPSFVKGRVFTKEAAKHLEAFRVQDVDTLLSNYSMSASRRAEIARRFGDNWSRWDEIEQKITDEDPDAAAILPQLRDLVAVSAGIQLSDLSGRAQSALSWGRTFTTLALLEKAAISSLGELVIAPIRGSTGNIPGDVAVTMANLMGHTANTLRWVTGLGRSEKLETMFELAEDIGIIAGTGHNSLMAARFAGGDPVGRLQSEALSSFFRRNGLEYLTNYTRVTSMHYGQVFMRRLAKQAEKNPAKVGSFLRELGVPKGREAEFAKWVRENNDGMPGTAETRTGEMGRFYRTALQRFVDQTVMRPNNSTRPKWANTPIGGLVFQLMNFVYSFQKNVINRYPRKLLDNDLTTVEKLAFSASSIAGLSLLVGLQGAARYWRDEVFNEDINDRKTDAAFVEGAISQAGLLGVADPFLQALTGVRYQKPLLASFTGPGVGGASDLTTYTAAALVNNSDETNTAERNAAKVWYEWVLEPMMQGALTFAPGGPISGKIASAATVGAIPGGRDMFVDTVAGEDQSTRSKPEIKSSIEWLFGVDSKTGGRSSGRDAGRSAGREAGRDAGR